VWVRIGSTAAGRTISIPKTTGIDRVAGQVWSAVISASSDDQVAIPTPAPQRSASSQCRSASSSSISAVASPTAAQPKPAEMLVPSPPAWPITRSAYGTAVAIASAATTATSPPRVNPAVCEGAAPADDGDRARDQHGARNLAEPDALVEQAYAEHEQHDQAEPERRLHDRH